MKAAIETCAEAVIGLIIFAGALISVLSAFGLIRFPDVYLRAHAATKSTTLGVLSILSGTFLYFWIFQGFVSAKLLLGIVFVFLTSPVAGHLNVRAAYRTDVPLWKRSIQDRLEPVLKGKRKSRN